METSERHVFDEVYTAEVGSDVDELVAQMRYAPIPDHDLRAGVAEALVAWAKRSFLRMLSFGREGLKKFTDILREQEKVDPKLWVARNDIAANVVLFLSSIQGSATPMASLGQVVESLPDMSAKDIGDTIAELTERGIVSQDKIQGEDYMHLSVRGRTLAKFLGAPKGLLR